MQIIEFKAGERFYFKGDWQTEPGIWEVIEHDKPIGMTKCKPITYPSECESLFFSRNVSVSRSE